MSTNSVIMSENKIHLRKEQVELIEELAHATERMGTQPAMAKIMALMSVNDETELTFDQIKDTLELSKSAVSQAITQLIAGGMLEYKTRIGDRKRYFYSPAGSWREKVARQFENTTSIVQVYKKILAQRPKNTPEFNQNLKELTEFLSEINSNIYSLLEKYRNKVN